MTRASCSSLDDVGEGDTPESLLPLGLSVLEARLEMIYVGCTWTGTGILVGFTDLARFSIDAEMFS